MTKLSFSSSVVVVENVWLGFVSFESSEVRESLSRSLSSKKNGVNSFWFRLGELIKGQTLTTGLYYLSSCAFTEFKGTNSEFWNSHHSLVIKNASNNNQDFGFFLLGVSNLD